MGTYTYTYTFTGVVACAVILTYNAINPFVVMEGFTATTSLPHKHHVGYKTTLPILTAYQYFCPTFKPT